MEIVCPHLNSEAAFSNIYIFVVSHPGISTGSIVGIAVGLTLGFLAFFAVCYIYYLRIRQARGHRFRGKRSRTRKKRRMGGVSGTFFSSSLFNGLILGDGERG